MENYICIIFKADNLEMKMQVLKINQYCASTHVQYSVQFFQSLMVNLKFILQAWSSFRLLYLY